MGRGKEVIFIKMPVRFRWERYFRDTEIGRIPRDWEVRRVGEIGEVITGKTPPTKERQYWNGNIPFITPSDIPDYDIRYDYKVERFVSKEWLYKAKNILIPKNSPCFVCIGSTIGKVCLTKEDSFTNQQINSVIPKKSFNYMFIFYNLRANQFRIKDEYGGGGAAKDIISKSKFEEIILPSPNNYEEQSRIAEVLSWFDELIEVKKKQNEILEKTAMAIFKSWFIDFEPFKNEEFIYSEELGKEIPNGWEVKRLKDFAIEIIVGATPLRKVKSYWENGTILWLTNKEVQDNKINFIFETEEKITEIALKKTNVKLIPPYSLIISFTASIGKIVINSIPIATNQQFISFVPKSREYLYYLAVYFRIFNDIFETYSGATPFDFVPKNIAIQIPVMKPPKPILQKFHSFVQPLFEKIINNQKEIMILKKVRDALLPLLVFGKLRVEEV